MNSCVSMRTSEKKKIIKTIWKIKNFINDENNNYDDDSGDE